MADSTFAEHVANTNTRLASIKASLIESSTFPEACVELTKWCSDQRAFTAHFEDNLMHALQVAMENGTKENYDFNLTHSLVSACFSHRKHLSKPSANRISRWYEQMRRLKKNGGKRKRAPPKPKEPPANVPPNGPLPVVTSPDGAPTENNNFMFSPGSDSSMWSAGGPMAAPGSSGHMQPGAPFPGPMGPPQAGMHSYGGQMPLPYGQMEGNHAMYDQRMLPNRAGRPGMMPDYPQLPMGQAPGAGAMMRMPVQYPAGHPQMPGHPQMQYGQMMRAPPVSVYGSMNHPQPFPVTAHPNPAPPYVSPEIRALYDSHVWKVERDLVEEGTILPGNHGCDALISPESMQFLESPDWDVRLSVWQFVKGSTANITFSVWINQTNVMNNNKDEQVSISIKRFLKSGMNLIQFGYHSEHQMHRFCCEIVRRHHVADLRKLFIQPRQDITHQNRAAYMQMAAKRQAGILSIPLNCSLSKKRMITPVRHNDCKKGLFDLAALINQHRDSTRYHCNHCNVYFKLSDLNVDYFLLHFVQSLPFGINEVIIDKNGMFRPGEMEKEEKPKRGKKRSEDSNGIKRIKSETFVKQEPGMFPDMHGRIPFSPMAMPGSVPPDWSRLQSPTFSMNSPNKIQLGPATPATPGLIFQNPASAGSMLNMSSPRQTMIPHPHPMMHHPEPVIAGSAPYTPESVKGDKLDALMQIPTPEMYPQGKVIIMHDERLVACFLKGTNDVKFDEIDTTVYEEAANNQPEVTQPLLAPGSSSSSGSTFTPPFDDIHLGNRASH